MLGIVRKAPVGAYGGERVKGGCTPEVKMPPTCPGLVAVVGNIMGYRDSKVVGLGGLPLFLGDVAKSPPYFLFRDFSTLYTWSIIFFTHEPYIYTEQSRRPVNTHTFSEGQVNTHIQ